MVPEGCDIRYHALAFCTAGIESTTISQAWFEVVPECATYIPPTGLGCPCGIPSGPGTVGGRAHLGLHCEEATSGLGRGGEAPGDTPLGHGNGRVMPVPPPANGQCTQKANSPATAQVREFRSVKRCTRESFAPHHHQRAPSTCWHRTAGCCLHGNHDGPCSTQMRSGPRKRTANKAFDDA